MTEVVLKVPIRYVVDFGLPSNHVVFVCTCWEGFWVRCVDDGRLYKIGGDADIVNSWDEVK